MRYQSVFCAMLIFMNRYSRALVYKKNIFILVNYIKARSDMQKGIVGGLFFKKAFGKKALNGVTFNEYLSGFGAFAVNLDFFSLIDL